jgi:hypothetical protein
MSEGFMIRRASCVVLVLLLMPSAATADPPLDAISRWHADGDAADSVGDNEGTAEGDAGFADGIEGEAFELDGTDAWVTVPSDASLRPGDGAFSASVWFRRSGELTYTDQSTPVVSMADGDFDDGWGLFSGGSLSATPSCLVDDVTHTNTQAVASVAVPIDTWAQIACVYDAAGDSLALFVNGALEASNVALEGTIAPSADLYIGRYRRFAVGGRDEFFRGRVDDAQYFARALADEEIASVFLEHVAVVFGDVDCSGTLNATDSLKVLRHAVGSAVSQTQPCPRMGSEFARVPWGDIDCEGSVIASDALKVLRVAVELDISQEEPCIEPGAPPV